MKNHRRFSPSIGRPCYLEMLGFLRSDLKTCSKKERFVKVIRLRGLTLWNECLWMVDFAKEEKSISITISETFENVWQDLLC